MSHICPNTPDSTAAKIKLNKKNTAAHHLTASLIWTIHQIDIISTLLLASGLQGKLVKTKFGQLWRSSIYQQFLFLFLSTGHEQNHKFEGVALRPLLSLDHQTLHRKKHQCTETDKSTLWDLGEEILGNGIWPIMALGNASSPFCRTKWFHVYVKIAF